MTIKYECNRCGKLMDYDSDKAVLLRVPDQEALAHLCPSCESDVVEFANQPKRRRK